MFPACRGVALLLLGKKYCECFLGNAQFFVFFYVRFSPHFILTITFHRASDHICSLPHISKLLFLFCI